MKNSEKIVLRSHEDIVKDNICFFTNSGKIFNRIPFKDLEKVYFSFKFHNVQIVLFDFTEDELLLENQRFRNCCHYIRTSKKTYDLGETFKKDKIINAQIIGNSIVVMREIMNSIEFIYFESIYEPIMVKLVLPELTKIPDHWIMIPPNYSKSSKIEVQVVNPEGGIIHIIENDSKKIYFNKS